MSVRLGVDAGLARVGVAVSQGSLCLPIQTLSNNEDLVPEILRLAIERKATAIYVGLPLALSGNLTQSSKNALSLARDLALSSEVPIRLIDERLTTKSAQARFHDAGKNTKASRQSIDAASAALILEFAIQSERDGELAGKTVEEIDE